MRSLSRASTSDLTASTPWLRARAIRAACEAAPRERRRWISGCAPPATTPRCRALAQFSRIDAASAGAISTKRDTVRPNRDGSSLRSRARKLDHRQVDHRCSISGALDRFIRGHERRRDNRLVSPFSIMPAGTSQRSVSRPFAGHRTASPGNRPCRLRGTRPEPLSACAVCAMTACAGIGSRSAVPASSLEFANAARRLDAVHDHLAIHQDESNFSSVKRWNAALRWARSRYGPSFRGYRMQLPD